MNPLIIVVGVIIVVILIASITKKHAKPATKTAQNNSIFDMYSAHGKVWLTKLWNIYKAGLTWGKEYFFQYEIYEKTFGVVLKKDDFSVKMDSCLNDMGLYNLDNPDEKTMKLSQFYYDLNSCLNRRFEYQYKPLNGLNSAEVMKQFGLNIDSNEILYNNISSISSPVDWYEEQIISTNINYSGFRYRSGGRMSFNTGTFNVVKDNLKGFVLLSRGDLFITNKRIIFISKGTVQNRVIYLNEILEFIFYKDGILLGKANGKKPLIYFPDALNALVQPDGLNATIRILDRVLSGNETEDLTPEDFKKLD